MSGRLREEHMRNFWHARAREDPYYFVDNSRPYLHTELAGFWAGGERDLTRVLGVLELRLQPGDSVIEIGCGVGRLTRAVAARLFQQIPDPGVTLAYVAEMGRVLKPGGWAAFQLSNDPRPHRRPRGARAGVRRVAAALERAPKGQHDPAWLGSAADLDELRRTKGEGGLAVERVVAEGTQFCAVRLRKRS